MFIIDTKLCYIDEVIQMGNIIIEDINPKNISINKVIYTPENDGISYGKRTVQMYELDFITQSGGRMITDDKSCAAKKGMLFFRKKGMQVEGIMPYASYFITFENDYNIVLPNIVDIIDFDNFTGIAEIMYNEYIFGQELKDFYLKLNLLKLLSIAIKSINENKNHSHNISCNKYLSKCIDYIHNNPKTQIDLQKLCDIAYLNKYTLCRYFNKMTGMTPIQYVNRYKINCIKKELLETEKSVNEIIAEYNFQNQSYFFKVFKKYTGVTPHKFRTYNTPWNC